MSLRAMCVCGWVVAIGGISALPAVTPTGKDLFGRRCSGCHSLDINKEGPRLRGVEGRRAGAVPDFPYSDALRNSGIRWSEDLLNKWLEDPDRLVKGTEMEFQVPNSAERSAIISWLKSQPPE